MDYMQLVHFLCIPCIKTYTFLVSDQQSCPELAEFRNSAITNLKPWDIIFCCLVRENCVFCCLRTYELF